MIGFLFYILQMAFRRIWARVSLTWQAMRERLDERYLEYRGVIGLLIGEGNYNIMGMTRYDKKNEEYDLVDPVLVQIVNGQGITLSQMGMAGNVVDKYMTVPRSQVLFEYDVPEELIRMYMQHIESSIAQRDYTRQVKDAMIEHTKGDENVGIIGMGGFNA